MRTLRHTIGCRVSGYESLEVTVDIGLTNDQIARAQAKGVHNFVLDFPNWDEVAEALELFEDDSETGEPTTRPLAKPAIPLTSKELDRLPGVLTSYIGNGYVISDANTDYMATVRPNLARSWGSS